MISIFKSIFHKHEDITEMNVIYCKECGSPFSCVSQALFIIESKKKTHRLNQLLGKRKYHGKGIRVKSKIDHTPLPEPPGLSGEEEQEYQMLLIEHFTPTKFL